MARPDHGAKPAFNLQTSLIDAVARQMILIPGWTHRTLFLRMSDDMAKAPHCICHAPTLANQPPPDELEQMLHIAQKFEVAARDEGNRALGKGGEERVLKHERDTLTASRHGDLAQQIRWVSEEERDGADYDIASFESDGRQRLIEVKTTHGWESTPFHVSRNELAVADERREEWCLFRLWNFALTPKAFELCPPLDAHVSLTTTSFQASFH